MRRVIRTYSGTRCPARTEREIRHRSVARRAAAEGIVLMKNEGVLPLKPGIKAALFGCGAGRTVKGGTGSGDVNEREVISIYEGLKSAGIQITSQAWIEDYEKIYVRAREEWKEMIFREAEGRDAMDFFQIYASHPFQMPAGAPVSPADVDTQAVGIYVISRIAGEGADRWNRRGDYELSEQEKTDLKVLTECCEDVIVILNAGGSIDLTEILCFPQVKGLLSIVQPGMEGGHAVADVLTGKVNPSGKLADTWAVHYRDFPNSGNFSHNNGNVDREYYEEGIYVGYRYFDTFGVKPAYAFGHGLSYTTFTISDVVIETDPYAVRVTAAVKNTGGRAGKEVLQIYVSCPQKKREREYKKLCGFAKTELLKSGASQQITIRIPAKEFASFDEAKGAWVIDDGDYGIWVGAASDRTVLQGALHVEAEVIYERVSHICPLQEELKEISPEADRRYAWEEGWKKEIRERGLSVILFAPVPMEKKALPANALDRKAQDLVKQLTCDQLIAMVIGEISKGQENALGAAGIMVPGAAGETSGALEELYDVPGISMADGPAGLRLIKHYDVDTEDGTIRTAGLLAALEGGFFAGDTQSEKTVRYYQYCTAIPVGTLLAQTWDTDLIEEVGRMVAEEMEEFGVAWWLAPGMNIHRNPLCGRNFEYYSEDPLLAGVIAAAMTRGVQSGCGVGTTVKHFACNNQEDNRMGVDSILSERALREIYLKGFEIAVKSAQPMAIMTSYNKINGVHAANCRDICTVAAREEWDFQGVIMTDWTTTMPQGGSESWKCAAAGNDLIMPGWQGDISNIKDALQDGRLEKEELEQCAKRMLKIIFQTLGYEKPAPYGAQFESVKPYIQVVRN